MVISDQEKCWPRKGRREQVGWKEGQGRPTEDKLQLAEEIGVKH